MRVPRQTARDVEDMNSPEMQWYKEGETGSSDMWSLGISLRWNGDTTMGAYGLSDVDSNVHGHIRHGSRSQSKPFSPQ